MKGARKRASRPFSRKSPTERATGVISTSTLFAKVPFSLQQSSNFHKLTSLALRVVLLVITRQWKFRKWKFTAAELATQTTSSVAGVRKAVRAAEGLGILTVENARSPSGGDVGWNLSVPAALADEEVTDEEVTDGGQGGDPAGASLPYIERDLQRDPPNPPCGARGARTQRQTSRTKVVEVDGVGVVDLARFVDPKLRLRDERKVEAIRAAHARAAAEDQAVDEAAAIRHAQQDKLLAEPMARCDCLLAELREAIDSCGLERDVPARAAAEDALRDGERVRQDSDLGQTEEDDLDARDALLDWCTRTAPLLVTLAESAGALRARKAMLAPFLTEATELRDAFLARATAATEAARAGGNMRAPETRAVWSLQDQVKAAVSSVHAAQDAAQAQAAVDALRASCGELEAAVTCLREVAAQAPPPRPGGRRG